MQRKQWLWLAGGLVVVLMTVAVIFNFSSRTPVANPDVISSPNAASSPSPTPTALPATPKSSSSTSGSANVSGPETPTGDPTTATNQSAIATPKPTSQASSPSASAIEKPRLEVPATPRPSVTTLPKSVEKAPAISGKAPQEGTASGKLTKGFPTEAMPIPEGVTIVDSSVSTQGKNVQVAMNYRTSKTPEQVLSFYEQVAAKKGWLANRGTGVDGAQNVTFGFGKDTTVATVRTAGTGATVVAVFGSFVAGK